MLTRISSRFWSSFSQKLEAERSLGMGEAGGASPPKSMSEANGLQGTKFPQSPFFQFARPLRLALKVSVPTEV